MGITKRKYNGENIRIIKEITSSLKKIAVLLPKNFNKYEILSKYQEYYPFEWQMLVERQEVYQEIDSFLIRQNKKRDTIPNHQNLLL